jgi:hypothetical protein
MACLPSRCRYATELLLAQDFQQRNASHYKLPRVPPKGEPGFSRRDELAACLLRVLGLSVDFCRWGVISFHSFFTTLNLRREGQRQLILALARCADTCFL